MRTAWLLLTAGALVVAMGRAAAQRPDSVAPPRMGVVSLDSGQLAGSFHFADLVEHHLVALARNRALIFGNRNVLDTFEGAGPPAIFSVADYAELLRLFRAGWIARVDLLELQPSVRARAIVFSRAGVTPDTLPPAVAPSREAAADLIAEQLWAELVRRNGGVMPAAHDSSSTSERSTRKRVPSVAPDTLPAPALLETLGTIRGPVGASFVRGIVLVAFVPRTAQHDRQVAIDAIDAIGGEVIGGESLGLKNGYYIVRIDAAVAPGDSSSGPLLRARATLKALPTVRRAYPIFLMQLVPDASEVQW